jgi:CHAT domain-containing protein
LGTDSSPSRGCVFNAEETPTPDDIVRELLALPDNPARRRFVARCLGVLAATELLPGLKDASERYQQSDPHASLLLAEILIWAAESAQMPGHRALGLLAKGDALRYLGQFQEARATLDEAGQSFLAQGDEVGWARTRIGWIVASHHLGVGEAALSCLDRARAILVQHQQWLRAATLDLNAGWVCYELSQYERALMFYERAQQQYETLGDEAVMRVAWVKANKAITLTELGEFHTALRLHAEVRRFWAQRGDTVLMLRIDHNIAYVYAGQGHYTQALHQYGAIYTAWEQADLEIKAAGVALDMLDCYLKLNRYAEALALAQDTAARFERHGTPTEAAKARYLCALAYSKLGDLDRALTLLDEAGRVFASAGLGGQLALVTLQRARLHLDDAAWRAARQAAEQAGVLFAERGQVIRRAQADLARAWAALGLTEYDAARALAGAVLAVARARDVAWLLPEGHHLRGRVAAAQGDDTRALTEFARAVEAIEEVQRTLAIDLRETFLDDKIAVYQDAIDTSLRLDQPENSFGFLERAKSRALVDYLANHLDVRIQARGAENTALLTTLARLREEHNWFYNRLYGAEIAEQAREAADVAPASADQLRVVIRDREKQIVRIVEQLALDRTEGLDIVPAADPGGYLLAIQQHLNDGAVALEYYFGPRQSVVFVVSRRKLVVVPLVVRPEALRKLVGQWQLNLATAARAVASGTPLDGLGRNARGILAALSRALIDPVAPYLAGHEQVVIVPYGPAHAVPFHALYDEASGTYLIERLEVTSCPSSRLLPLCAARAQQSGTSAAPGVLTVAYSDGGRLPAVVEEARTIAALLPGEQYLEAAATRTALIEAAPRHRVIHLAAHGEARLDNPTFAHLKLADGQLGTTDIFNLDLSGALVTLSACETGRAIVSGGDELIGLSRAFLHAGAATLVQSLWRVEDSATARLMAHFYGSLRAGRDKGAALREAQRALLADSGPHPYFWAPFQLLGDRGPL